MDNNMKYWLWLTLSKGITSRKITYLLDRFNSCEDIYNADKSDYKDIEGINIFDMRSLCNKSLDTVDTVVKKCKVFGIHIMTFDNPMYPNNLKNIFDPPYVLYVRCKEKMDLNKELMITVVGNRKMTDYGKAAGLKISTDLARSGITVVSGMAEGIDGIAHSGAIAGKGKTVAVLGCGANICYPPFHKELMSDIINNGMVITEYPPDSPPDKKHFPERNRIMCGLSNATIVVEAPKRSGALITAHLALEQGRDVFALPGSVNLEHSVGTNNLIKDGAKLITSALDIVSEYQNDYFELFEKYTNAENNDFEPLPPLVRSIEVTNSVYKDLSDDEKKIIDVLSITPTHIDFITKKSGLSVPVVTSALTLLEISGLAEAHPGNNFSLKV